MNHDPRNKADPTGRFIPATGGYQEQHYRINPYDDVDNSGTLHLWTTGEKVNYLNVKHGAQRYRYRFTWAGTLITEGHYDVPPMFEWGMHNYAAAILMDLCRHPNLSPIRKNPTWAMWRAMHHTPVRTRIFCTGLPDAACRRRFSHERGCPGTWAEHLAVLTAGGPA